MVKNNLLIWLGEQILTKGAHQSSVLGNWTWIDRLLDKIINEPRSVWAIYISLLRPYDKPTIPMSFTGPEKFSGSDWTENYLQRIIFRKFFVLYLSQPIPNASVLNKCYNHIRAHTICQSQTKRAEFPVKREFCLFSTSVSQNKQFF